jgi:hypothetical protein
MTRKELKQVLTVLEKIKPSPNPFVEEAILSVKRDIARREQQSKQGKENKYDTDFYL